jgi:hypothetical protein
MFYGQCNACGERWSLGTASTCKCPDLVTWDASAFKKPWQGLNFDELPDHEFGNRDFILGARWAEAKLKEKNAP